MLPRPVKLSSIYLRPANWDDCTKLLLWKNDPVMRKFSIVSHGLVKYSDHLKWYEANMGKTRIITDGEVDYGDIRIDNGEVAIKLDPLYRGMSIGETAMKLVTEKNLTAKIVDGNDASMKLFLKLGFQIVAHEDNYSILERN